MNGSPVITGVGLVTPLGDNAGATWASLLTRRRITDHARVPLEFPPGRPRVSRLAIRAAREAAGRGENPATALVVGTSKGPVEEWLKGPSRLSDVEGPSDFGLAEVASDVARALGLAGGPRLSVSSACASGLHALLRGAMMIRAGEARRVLVVAAESSLHPLFVGSFRRLGVLPPEGVGCRPFDESRAGFLMSEAAAAVCLEVSDDPNAVRIDRFAMGADATHLTGSDPEGRSLRRILKSVMSAEGVDFIHAHGTGTVLNDPMELAALESAVAASDPPADLYSHKGALGHAQGAAGLIAVAINWLVHRHAVVPPNVQTRTPLPTARLRIAREPRARRVRRSLVTAGGFGGALAAVTLAGD